MLSSPVLLSYFPYKTHARIKKALAFFGSCDHLFDASIHDLIEAGWDTDTAEAFVLWRKNIPVDQINAHLASHDIKTITIEDDSYPPQLRQLHHPPLCLFVRGSLERYTTSIAIVGTRKMSSYGKLIIDRLVPELVDAGVSIISGLAYGVDSASHHATLMACGTTHAVLGSGIDDASITPRHHLNLAKQIITTGGSILSEYPPGTSATKYTFPERNRIIAALSKATLVVEADERSGSLITASCAMDIGRDVCSVPHPIHTPLGKGPNELIKNGAHVITDASDIRMLLNISSEKRSMASVIPSTPLERSIYAIVQTEAKHIDEIIARTGEPGTTVMSTLSIMEMKGQIRNMGSMMYIAV